MLGKSQAFSDLSGDTQFEKLAGQSEKVNARPLIHVSSRIEFVCFSSSTGRLYYYRKSHGCRVLVALLGLLGNTAPTWAKFDGCRRDSNQQSDGRDLKGKKAYGVPMGKWKKDEARLVRGRGRTTVRWSYAKAASCVERGG
jgi:hypothetical protein